MFKRVLQSASPAKQSYESSLNTMHIFGFIFLMIAFSCQKELSLETHIAKGTLKEFLFLFLFCYIQNI